MLTFELFRIVKSLEFASSDKNLKLSYNANSRDFTILNSSNVSIETIEEIFANQNFQAWQSQVQNKIDQYGNRLVTFIPITDRVLPEEAKRLGRDRKGLVQEKLFAQLIKSLFGSTDEKSQGSSVEKIMVQTLVDLHHMLVTDIKR